MNTARIIRWLVVALVASVSVNMFVAGWYVGQESNPSRPAARGGGVKATLESLARDLSPQSARTLRKALHARAPEVRPVLQDLRDAREDLRDALAADPFDRNVLAEAQARVRQATATLQRVLHNTLAQVAGEMPVRDRRLLARFREDFR